ncbi:MAG: carbohydrate-binding domain-containing protein [Clostridia bacterium]|nr:carbohydrate-binding domain-containing protein [Clostridia bacterium]
MTVYSMDDAIHANAGDELENGSTGAGNITVSGGKVTINCADDGIHADASLTISGGYVNIAKSHEGLEANVVTVSGGDVFIYAEDDGINACAGNTTPLVKIAGGYLDVTTPSGDTDAVDSNGNVTMSGGFALIKGGASSGSMAGSVDVDGTVTVTGGTLIAFGGICEVPSSDDINLYVSSGTTFSAGDYTLTDSNGNAVATFTLDSSYSSLWIASDALTLGSSYTLNAGTSAVLTWTQSSAYTGDTVQGGFGGGFGPGGRR